MMRANFIRTLSVLCVLALLIGLAPATLAASDAEAVYRVEGRVTGRTMTVSIYARGIEAVCGRFALGFDPDKLQMPEAGRYMDSVVKPGGRIETLGEGKTPSQLFSQEKGHVMFAWYPNGAAIDATASYALIATVTFTLKEGVTADSFDSHTLYMYNAAGYLGWETGAWMMDNQLDHYANCIAGQNHCGLEFDYPGCEETPANAISVYVSPSDSRGAFLSGGIVRIADQEKNVEQDRRAVFQLAPGKYTMLVTAPGYEDRVADLTVSGGAVFRNVQLRSMQQLVDQVAAALEIGFQGDDTAESVTRDLILPIVGEQNTTITWTSSDQSLLSNYGDVFRQKDAKDVTVTAQVAKDGRTATKTFTVHITAMDVPETIIPDPPTPPDDPDIDDPEPPVDPPKPLKPLTDIDSVASWAGEAINTLREKGIINGTSDTTYSPQNPITRADFLTLLMRMFVLDGTMGPGFEDVPQSAYYHDPVCMAQSLGIAKGITDTKFNPTGKITRQDMIVMTYRLLDEIGLAPESSNGDALIAAFPDGSKTSDYAKTAMGGMLSAGYINGKGSYLAPRDHTTRAEAATFLYRIYQAILEVK